MKYLIAHGKMADVRKINLNDLLTESSFILSQKAWYGYGGIPLFDENVKQLKNQAEVVRLTTPPLLEDRRELYRLTKRMLNKNRFYRSGNILFELFRIGDEVHMLITCQAFRQFDFPYDKIQLISNMKYEEVQNISKDYARSAMMSEFLFDTDRISSRYINRIIIHKDSVIEQFYCFLNMGVEFSIDEDNEFFFQERR